MANPPPTSTISQPLAMAASVAASAPHAPSTPEVADALSRHLQVPHYNILVTSHKPGFFVVEFRQAPECCAWMEDTTLMGRGCPISRSPSSGQRRDYLPHATEEWERRRSQSPMRRNMLVVSPELHQASPPDDGGKDTHSSESLVHEKPSAAHENGHKVMAQGTEVELPDPATPSEEDGQVVAISVHDTNTAANPSSRDGDEAQEASAHALAESQGAEDADGGAYEVEQGAEDADGGAYEVEQGAEDADGGASEVEGPPGDATDGQGDVARGVP